MNDNRKTVSKRLPRQWSLTAVTILITGIAIGLEIDGAMVSGFALIAAGIFVLVLRNRFPVLINMSMGIVFLGIAIILGGISAAKSPVKLEPEGKIDATGTITMVEAMTKGRQRIRFTPDPGVGGGADWRLIMPRRLDPVMPGDQLNISVRLQPPLPQLLPHGFDFTAHAAKNGFGATGFVAEATRTGRVSPGVVESVRAGVQSRLLSRLDGNEAAVASAVLLGLRALIPPELRESFRASGLAHLLAISGLHMALFCGGVIFVLRAGLALMPQFSSRFHALKIAVSVALPIGAGYLLLAGMPISAIRAYGMMVLFILAILMDRRGLTLHHVALMAIVILLVDPAALYDPAFQMSFAAVFALVAGWSVLQRLKLRQEFRHKPGIVMKIIRSTGGVMVASVLASAASMPFVLHHFGVTTAWSILANVIGMPLMGLLIMPAGALALILMPLGLEFIPLVPMGTGLRLLIHLAEVIEGLPLSAISVKPPPGIVLLLLTLAALTGCIMKGRWLIFPGLKLLAAVVIWYGSAVPVAGVITLHGRIHAMVIDDQVNAVASSSGNAFAHAILRRPFGLTAVTKVDDTDHDCRPGLCFVTMADEKRAAYVFRRAGLTEACRVADLVIALVTARYPCRSGAMLIDRRHLERDGGVLVYQVEDGFKAVSVNTTE